MQKYTAPLVHVTYDYNLFKLHSSNRPPNHWPKIAKSLKKKDMSRYVPIIVIDTDEGYIIIDGQGRYFACIELGLPIYYIVAEGVGIEDVSIFNTGQENWTLSDYLNFYASQGFPHYKRVQSALKELVNIKLTYLVNTIWQGGGRNRGSSSASFKDGTYTFNEAAISKTRLVSTILHTIQACVDKKEIRNTQSLVGAISSLVLHPKFSPNRMIEQIKKYPFLFRAQADADHYKRHLEEIYNYRKRGDNGNIRF